VETGVYVAWLGLLFGLTGIGAIASVAVKMIRSTGGTLR
jgi:hypothetical protein